MSELDAPSVAEAIWRIIAQGQATAGGNADEWFAHCQRVLCRRPDFAPVLQELLAGPTPRRKVEEERPAASNIIAFVDVRDAGGRAFVEEPWTFALDAKVIRLRSWHHLLVKPVGNDNAPVTAAPALRVRMNRNGRLKRIMETSHA